MAKTKYIETPEKMWQLFDEYRGKTKNDPIEVQDFVGKDGDEVYRKRERPLTMEGFENYCFINHGLLSIDQYFQNQDNAYKDYLSICRAIRKVIRQDQIEGGMAGIYNPSITQRLNNLVEKVQEDGSKEVTIKVKYESKGTGSSTEQSASGSAEGTE